MARLNLYAQNRHVIVVDGVPLSGFADGDYVQTKVDGNAAVRSQGGDGPAMNLTVGQGGQLIITLFPTSPSLGILYGLRDAQLPNPRLFTVVVLSGTEEVITCAGCGFGDLPQFQTGGPSMQGRQFVFECLQITMDTSAIETLAGGFV